MKRAVWVLIAVIWFITAQSFWVDLYYPDYREQRNKFMDEYLILSTEYRNDPINKAPLYDRKMHLLKQADSCNTLYLEKINKKWVLHIGKALGL